MKGIEYIEAPGPEYDSLTEPRARTELGMPGWRRLEEAEFPDERVKWGCEYDTWCANPMVYCAFLLRRFVMRGGRVVQGVVREVDEVWAMRLDLGRADGVVNATGHGFGDKDMFVTRGKIQARIPGALAEESWLIWHGSANEGKQVRHVWSPTPATQQSPAKTQMVPGHSVCRETSKEGRSLVAPKSQMTGTQNRVWT